MNGRLSLGERPAAPVLDLRVNTGRDAEFRGLMALLAGCELALVDLGTGLSMHSGAAKDFNMGKAKAALEIALRDFKRGNGQMFGQEKAQ